MTRQALRHQEPKKTDNTGFTLVEIIVTILLLGIIGSFGGYILVNAARSYTFAHDNAELTQKAQVAMMRITTELSRVNTFDCSSPNQVSYTRCDDESIIITIRKDGTNILYEIAGTPNILVDQADEFNVQNLEGYCTIELILESANGIVKNFATIVNPITGQCPI
ncbi:PilW family protein [Desulfonatronum thioautotrophicum]|uniref:PilW family protein n=1 Tax=Desulfonatronum thioautotrophicum TaxID=617001 RepID=UPI0005EAEC8E|nr:prepilin-type N-terminal cleavage/methylation domain-containing protein [Desulfonatronum thioautotrophicum]